MRRLFVKTLAGAAFIVAASAAAQAQEPFNNVITGEVLNLEEAGPDGKDTEAFKTFLATGKNIYLGNDDCLAKGEELFLSMCSGCHGHVAEGKLGPGLNDTHWTYPQARGDKGLFEVIFGGASGMMGPMYGSLNVDEMLLTMAWVRHLYKDKPEDAGEWLTAELQKNFKPYDGAKPPQPGPDAPQSCKMGE